MRSTVITLTGPWPGRSWESSRYRVSEKQGAEANERALASGKDEVLMLIRCKVG